MKNKFKIIKLLISMILICSMIFPSYATLSSSDGSFFVTKAEFDAALADFNGRLTMFEAGINSKIDSQVTSYLDRNGIWSGKSQFSPGNKVSENLWDYVWGPFSTTTSTTLTTSSQIFLVSEKKADYVEQTGLTSPVTKASAWTHDYQYNDPSSLKTSQRIGWGQTCLSIVKLCEANKSGLFKFTFTDWADGSNLKSVYLGSSLATPHTGGTPALSFFFSNKISKHIPSEEAPYQDAASLKQACPITLIFKSDGNCVPRGTYTGQFFVKKGESLFFGIFAGATNGFMIGITQGNGTTYNPVGAHDLRFSEADIY